MVTENHTKNYSNSNIDTIFGKSIITNAFYICSDTWEDNHLLYCKFWIIRNHISYGLKDKNDFIHKLEKW